MLTKMKSLNDKIREKAEAEKPKKEVEESTKSKVVKNIKSK